MPTLRHSSTTGSASGGNTRIPGVYQCTDDVAHGERVAPSGVKAVIIVDDAGRNNALGIRRYGAGREFRLRIGRKAGRRQNTVMYG